METNIEFINREKYKNIYLLIIFTITIKLLILSMKDAHIPSVQGLVFFALLAIVAESLTVKIADCEITVTSAILIATLLSCGQTTAIIVSMLSTLIYVTKKSDGTYVHTLNKSPYKTISNFSILVTSAILASSVYRMTGGLYYFDLINQDNIQFTLMVESISNSALSIFAYIITDFIVNTFMIAVYLHFNDGLKTLQAWVNQFMWSSIGLAMVGLFGAFISMIYLSYGWFFMIIVLIPLAIANYAFSLYASLRKNYLGTIRAISDSLEAKDLYTCGHSQRVQIYSSMIADELNLSPKTKNILEVSAILHDVGKIGVSETILNKPGKLTAEEFQQISLHSEIGSKIVSNIDDIYKCSDIIKYHHSYFNGSGYPKIEVDVKVPFLSRILAVADTFDAMTSDRPYRSALGVDIALGELKKMSGTQFDPKVVEAFVSAMEKQDSPQGVVEKLNRNLAFSN